MTILAAIDDSAAAMPVLATARALEPLLGGPVEALHVGDRPGAGPEAAAEAERIPLRVESGSPLEVIQQRMRDPDVAALVIGSRSTPGGRRPAGNTAIALMTAATKQVIVVPPNTPRPGRIRRILVPLEGSPASASAVWETIEHARVAGLEIIVLHVREESRIHAFSDQPHHEGPAWAEEFLARFCPLSVGELELELRVGLPEEVLGNVAQESRADLIALGWSQDLSLDRAAVVRAALSGPRVPVLLIPANRAALRAPSLGPS